MILLVGGEKGGTGKTTLATNLAAMRAQQGHDVLIIDTDTQGSASFWAATRDEHEGVPRVSCVQKFGKGLAKAVKDLAERYEDIIIDAGGRDSTELRAAMIVAEFMCVPVQASQFDFWTLTQMDELVSQAQTINLLLKARIVINRASTHPGVTEASDAAELIADFENLEFSGVVIRDRIIYRRAASQGLSVGEVKPIDHKALSETQSLYNTLYHVEIAT